jgi:hypothetical protein
MILPRQEEEVYPVTAEGRTVGENLVAACLEAGFSHGDIVVIAHRFSIILPGNFEIPDTHNEPRSKGNRFNDPVPV